MYVSVTPSYKIRIRRQRIYEVLRNCYPAKLSASEIARLINQSALNQEPVLPRHISYALRYFALRNRHFSVFLMDGEVRYSVYILEEEYDLGRE